MAVANTTDELDCTRERDNFIRLSVLLIDGGTKVLRELFDSIHPPSSLSHVLRTRETDIKKNTKLTRPQREVLYGLKSGDYGKSQDFDITLLFQLLRCKPLCNLTPPSTGWDDLPSPEDTSPAADMARLKYYRNKVYGHSPDLKVQEEQFSIIWKEIQDVLLRLAELVNPARGVEWNKMISEYGSATLTHADNDNVRELDRWYQNDLDIKDEMVKLKATLIQEMSDMKTMLQDMQRLNPNQSQGPNTQATLRIHVNLDSYQPRVGRRVASQCHPSGYEQCADQMQLPREPQPSQQACASEADHPNPLAESQEVPTQSHIASASQSNRSVNTMDHPQMTPEAGSPQQDKEESLFLAIADLLFKDTRPLTNKRFKEYLNYLIEVKHLVYISQQTGSLIITVACPSLEILQGLWDDYKSAHLKEVTERCLVTGDILREFDLVEVNLEVTIPEEEYFSCRRMLIEQEIGVSDLAAIRNIERAIDEGPLSSAQTIISNIKKATVSARTSEATNTAKKVYPSGMGVDDSYPLKCQKDCVYELKPKQGTLNIFYSQMKGVPPEVELNSLAKEIPECWYALGIQLGLGKAAVDNIHLNNVDYTSPVKKAFQMLVIWRNRGRCATYGELYEALRRVDRHDLVELMSSQQKATVSAQTSEDTNTAKKVYPSGFGLDDSYPLKCESIPLPVQKTADLDQSRDGDSEEYEILRHEDGDQENAFKQELPKPPVPAADDSGRLQSLQASAKTFMENQDAQMDGTKKVFVRSSSSPEARGSQPQLRYIIFHVYMPENDNATGMDVIIYDHINKKNFIIKMNRKGNGIWESPPCGISLDCNFSYSYRAWYKDILLPAYGYIELLNRPITEAVHHYNVFRSWMSETDYQTRLFWGQYRFVHGFYKSICSSTKSLYDCLVLTYPMEFGKKISKSNVSNIVSWIARELERGSSDEARVFLLTLLGKFVSYYPEYVQLDVKRGVIDAAFMALTTLNSDEIPRCSKVYLKAVAPLLINRSSYQSRLALLTFLCTTLDRVDLLEVVHKVDQACTDEEQFDHLLEIVISQLARLSEVMKQEIATRFALEAPCLKSLLKCGKALYSVYQSSSDMANTFANIFESKCGRIAEPANVYSDSLLQVWGDIPDGLQDLIEASFVEPITRCMKHDSTWDKTKLQFVRQLLLGEVLKKPEHIWAVIEEMSVSKCEGLLNLVVEVLDADKFCSTWREVDSGQKETLCFSCCESIRCMYDKQAGTHTVNNTLFALKQVCKTRNVRDDEELKESFKDRVMNCLQERLKPCPLSSFLEAFELAGNVSNAPKKWYIQGLAKAFWKSPGDSHRKLEQILVTIRKADPSETEGCLHLTSFAEKIVLAVLEFIELPVPVNDFAPETDEAIIAATVANAETWISLLSANGSVNALRNHPKILRTEKSIKWLAESICSSRNIRVEFIYSLEQTTSVELLGRFCAAVFSPETKEEEEASLKIQIAHLFSKCKEHFFMLIKMNDLLDFCQDVSSNILELVDEKFLFTEMADRISNRSELSVERIVKCDYYWAPFQQLLSPAEALSELKTSHVFRNIAIHCLHEDVKMKSNISSGLQRPLSSAFATHEVEASDVTAASGVQRTVEDVAVFLKTKAIVSFQEACNPLYDDFLQMSLVEASIAWKGIDQSDVSEEVELVERYFTRGHISESVRLSIRQLLQLPYVKDKARALLKAFNSFGMAQTDESGLFKKFQNIIDLTDKEEMKLFAIFEAIDEDVQKVCRFLDCTEFLEVIMELGKSKEFITFITEKADENMGELTDAVGDYSEQSVTEQTVSDLIEVHAFLRSVVTVQMKGAMVLLSTAYRCMPRGVEIAGKLQSCRSKTHALKSLYAENRSEKTKEFIRKILSEGYYRLKLTLDGQWSVTMSYNGSEETGDDHTMAHLQDLCSRAHLLARARKKSEAESPQTDGKSSIERFSEFIEEVNLISELINVSSQLQRSGHPTFREFEAELQAANTEAIKRKVEEVKGELTKWKEVLNSARSKYTHLNFFYSDQLRVLEEFFTQAHREDATSSVKTAIFDLMRFVDPSITWDELDQFLTHYHHPILSSGPKRLEDNLYAMGSALDEIFEARSLFKTKPEQGEDLATQVQEFCIVRLEPESLETVNAMMSLYAHTAQVFPSPNQVMFCHKETSADELSLFIRRCFGNALSGKPEPLYCMANVEVLDSDIQLELVRLLKEFQGQTNTPYNLCLIIRADRHHLLVQQFLKFNISRVLWLTNSELQQTFRSYFPDVVFVTSDLPGLGKTEWIREDAAKKGRGVTIVPLSGIVSRERLVQRLSALKLNGDYDCLHFDLSDIEDPLALDTFLFEFIALGLLSHGTKLVHRPSRHIYIEVANTINHWLRDSLIVCKCFRREHRDSGNPYDKLIVSSEIRSPLQVVCHYFDALQTKTLKNTDVCFDGPHKVEPLSQERCTDLLSNFYPENRDFTYTRFNTFLSVFAEQLLRLSASQFLRNDRLQEMTEDSYEIRQEVVWSLLSISKELVDYRRTAQPNVEEARKPSTHAPTAEAVVARVQGMSSWSSDHPVYIFYGQSMKPLYRKTTLMPAKMEKLIVSQSSTSKLPDYENMTQDELREFLEEISNQQSTCGNDLLKSYVLTVDNILKMVFILLRLRAKLPVVLMGETGCGKTSLVRFLAQSYKVPFDTFNLHAGTMEEEVLSFIKKMERKAEEAKASGKPVWVFLDEINTCDHLGLISEITCHRRVQGRPLPSNLVFIAACNPYCIRPAEARQTEGLLVKESSDELSRLVYRVHSLPEVLMAYVWDFGSLDGKDELSYIQRMTEGLFQDHKDGIFANLLFRSQLFVREAEKTKYCVSLRDIDRFRKMLVWFRESVQSRSQLPPAQIEEHVREAYEDVARMDKEKVAVVLALALCYQSRFADADLRKSYQREMEDIMASDDHTNLKRGDFAKIVRIEEEEYLARMELPPGTAKNAALRENVFVLLSSICNRIPVFVVGKPGCSKSLSMQVIRSNLRGAESSDEFLKTLPRVYVVSFQGSKSSTSEGISKVFEKAHKYKEYNRDSFVLPVVLLDEVGLAEQSSHNPLKVLHSLLEPSTDRHPEVAVVGLSNWALDPAKMNRGIYLSRPDPTIEDLCETGKSLRRVSRGEHAHLPSDQELMELAKAYHKYQQTQTYPNFHGLRDYYSFVRCLSQSLTDAVFSPSGCQCIQEALQRNFGGVLQNPAIQSCFMKELPKCSLPVSSVLPVKDLICRNIQDRSARHLMLLTAGNSAIQILQQILQETKKEIITILGSHFVHDLADYDFQVLSEIILHMERDCVLILRDLECIYGSLYNMLNQNYTVGEHRRCRVALGLYSVPNCQVHDGFRCIVMKDRAKVDYTDAPFLNRFEKQSLRFEDALSATQMAACIELTSWATEISTMSDSSLLFDEKDMFLDFHRESIPSLVLYHGQDERLSSKELIQECKNGLMLTATPDGILRTVKSKWAETRPTEVKTMYEDHLRKYNHQGFKAFIQDSLATCTSEERKAGLKLVVMTHSSVYQTVPDLLEGLVTCQTATLSLFETQRQFSSFIKSFWTNLETSMLILQCRPEVDGCHMSLVQNIIEQHHFEFQKSSSEAFHFPQVEKHVCLILHIRKELLGSEAQSRFKGWKQVTVDSLANPELPIRSLLGASVCQIIESHDRLATEIIRDELLSCFTQIQNLSLKRYIKIVQAVRGSKAITEALKDHVIKCLRKSSSEDEENAPWLLSVATNQEVLINSSTFQDAVYSYITDLVKTSLAMLVYQLESKSAWNAIVCNQPSNQKIPVWIKLLGSETIVNLEYVSYPRESDYYVLETPVLDLVYPFSFVFATRVQEIKSRFLANVKTLEEDEERLDQSWPLEAKEMFSLVERFSSLVEPKLREILEDTWLQENVMSYIEDLMDLKTVEHSKTLSRCRRVAVMKAIIASHIRHITTSHDLVLFVTHVHVWFWLNSSLITSILQVVKVYQDLDPSDPRLDQLLQEYSSAFPTTLSQVAEDHDTQAEIAQDSSDTESTFSYTGYESMQHFEVILVNEMCQMMTQMTAKLVSLDDWQRNATLVLSAVAQIFEFGDLPISFHVLRVCNDFMSLFVLPSLASVESVGEVAMMNFLECPDDFEAVLRIAENCGPGRESQQFLALFFRRCIESWPTDYAESHKEILSLMIKIILSARNDVRLAYFGPVVKLLLSDVPPFVFYQLLHTSDPIRESGFLSLLNGALLKLEVEGGIDAHPAVLICDSIEDYSFRRISSMEATGGTQTYSDLESSDLIPSSAINILSDFTAAVEVFREGSNETRGLRKICAVAFIRSLLRFVAKYCVIMFYESGELPACSEDMAELFRELNVFLETSSSGRSTKSERSTPCLFFLRELRQNMSMYEVKQLVQSTVVCAILPLFQELRWSSGRPSKIGHGLLNSLKRCSTTSDAVSALIFEKQAGKLRKLIPQILESHTERIYLFSAVSSIYLEQCHGMTTDSKRANTERLAKELKVLNEVYVELTRRLVGVVSFCTPELQLNSESSSTEVQRAFLLTHIAACMSPVIQDAPINDCPLVALMVDPKLCQESYLPGLPDNLCHISAAESRSETKCYACRCGVAFITAINQQTCSKCSTQFEPLPVLCRNRKKGASVQAKGYTKVNPEDLRDVWQSVRNLSPPVFRILHLLVHACLYLGYALGIVKEQSLSEFIGVEDEMPSTYCFKHICNDLRVLENLLNVRQEDAVNLIHLVLNSSGELLAHDRKDKLCKEHDGRESWEARFADSVEPLLSDKDKRCVRLLPVETVASKSTCAAASLEEEIEEQDCLPEGIAQRNAIMPRLFRSTRRRSTADLKASFFNDPDEVRKHPFLRLVFQYEDVLPLLHHLIPLLKWTQKVESYLSHRISREEARSREISTVIFQLKSEKSDLQKASDDFQEAWRMVLPLLKEEIEEDVPFISDDFPISWCLLDKKGNGRFLCSVLKILASYQNEFLVQALVLANEEGCHTSNFLGNPRSPNVMPLVPLQECGFSDVICFEWPETDQTHEEDDGFLSYSQHNTEYGRGWDVHYNFGMIETALARTLLWRKAFLSTKDGLREFTYSNELFHSGANILKEIENVITQEPLTRDLHSGLQHLKTVERAKVRDLLNRLEVVLCFLKQTQGDPEQPLVEYNEKWISMLTSFPKANLPQPHDRIQLKHVVALYEGLEDILAAKALSGLADDFRARLPDSKSTEARFSKERKPFSPQAVLTALYRFIYRYLATPRNLSICKEPLLTFLNDRTLWPMEKLSAVSLEEPEIMSLMQELFPMELKVKHIHKLATLLQRKLRPAQLAKVPGRGRKKLADV